MIIINMITQTKIMLQEYKVYFINFLALLFGSFNIGENLSNILLFVTIIYTVVKIFKELNSTKK